MQHLQSQKSQPTERKAGMAARKASPAIMQHMVIFFRTNSNGDQSVLRTTLLRLAACNEVWSWTSNRVFDNIGKEGREHNADSKT